MEYFFETMMHTLKRHEGLRLTPYTDSMGIWTIGHGRNLEKGISVEEAHMMLKHDIMEAMRELDREKPFWRDLPLDARLVICNMAFNLGMPKLNGFVRMWRALEDRNYKRAAKEMLDSKWANQVKGRAEELADQMAGATFSSTSKARS